MVDSDRQVTIELLAQDFASKVLTKFGKTAEVEGKKAERSLGRVGKAGLRLKRDLAGVAAGLIGVAAGIAAIRRGTRDFLSFNEAITEAETILDSTRFSIQKVEKEVLDLALALGVNETIVARGFYQTLSAGVTDAADATEVLTRATELAVAGFTEVEITVDAITTVLNAYGRSAEDAGEVSDVLFKTVELGKTRISELGSTLGSILPDAVALGISLEEVTAALAAQTKQGASTAEATTRLRAILTALKKNADEVDDALRRQGGSFDQNTIRTRGLVTVLEDLFNAYGGNALELTKLLGRSEAYTGIQALAKDGAVVFKETLEGLEGSIGATGRALDIRLASPAQRFTILIGGARQGLQLLGGQLVKTLTGTAVTTFGDAQTAAEALRDTIGGIGILISRVSGALQDFGFGVVGANIADAAGFEVDPVKAWVNVLAEAREEFRALQDLAEQERIGDAQRKLFEGVTKELERFLRFENEVFDEFGVTIQRQEEIAAKFQERITALFQEARKEGAAFSKEFAREFIVDFNLSEENFFRQIGLIPEKVEDAVGDIEIPVGADVEVDAEAFKAELARLQAELGIVQIEVEVGTASDLEALGLQAEVARQAFAQLAAEIELDAGLLERALEAVGAQFRQQAAEARASGVAVRELFGPGVELAARFAASVAIAAAETGRLADSTDAAARANLERQVRALEVQAGIVPAIQAEREAILAHTEALKEQARLLGITGDELDRISAAGAAAAASVGTFSEGFRRAAQQAADPGALGARAFHESIGLARDFGTALATAGDAGDVLKERLVRALIEIAAQALITRIILGSLFTGGGTLPGHGGGHGSFSNAVQNERGGIMEGEGRFFERGGVMPGQRLQTRSYAFGGVADSPQVAIFAEKPGMAEAFVPLGPSRKIPVEFPQGAGAGVGGATGGQPIEVAITVQSLDPRTAAEVFLSVMPTLQQELASAISAGTSRKLVTSIRGVSGARG